MTPTFDVVLFDYGHTLVDLQRPETHLLEAYRQINLRLEKELERDVPQAAELLVSVSERVDKMIGHSYYQGSEQEVDITELYRDALDQIGITCPPDTLNWVMEQEQAAWFNGVLPSPHARSVLETLKGEGVRLAIVSNAAYSPQSMRDQLHFLDLFDLFDATIYSSEVGVRKPNPAIYEEALRQTAAPRARTLFIGDRVREDVRGPRSCGITAVMTHEFRQEQAGPGLDVEVLPDLSGLPGLVLNTHVT
jgi:putative hydrolase of the HAD superfamily